MTPSRRTLIRTAAGGIIGGAMAGCAGDSGGREGGTKRTITREQLEHVAAQPVLKLDSVTEPVIVESVELLRNGKTFLLRTRSKAGVEAISVPNSSRMEQLYPLFLSSIMPFFVGKDARELENHLWEVFRWRDNYKYQ